MPDRMGIGFENPMGMGVDMSMGMIFTNGYGCGYSYTCPESAPRPSLDYAGSLTIFHNEGYHAIYTNFA